MSVLPTTFVDPISPETAILVDHVRRSTIARLAAIKRGEVYEGRPGDLRRVEIDFNDPDAIRAWLDERGVAAWLGDAEVQEIVATAR